MVLVTILDLQQCLNNLSTQINTLYMNLNWTNTSYFIVIKTRKNKWHVVLSAMLPYIRNEPNPLDRIFY